MTIEKTAQLINDLIQSNKLVNGYIFYGPELKTLQQASFYLLECYFSQQQPFQLTQERLDNCPDIIYFSPETTSIKVDDIHHIQDRIKYGPSVYSRLFVIIDQADLLTNQAANAFLKTLEEPIDNVTFILLTTRFKQLIPTIRSRCQHLYIAAQQTFGTVLTIVSDAAPTAPLLTFPDFLQYNKIEQLAHIESISKDKKTAKKQLDYWVETQFNSGNQSYISELLECRNRLEFNVNVRLQLEQLVL